MQVFKLEPVTFHLGTITGKTRVSFDEIVLQLIWVLLEAENSYMAFSSEGEVILDLEEVDRGQSVITEKFLVMKRKTQTGQEEWTL